MKFGYFDDANKEYVITSPKTPLPWINYLGSENFFSLISNTCGGYSFYKDAKLLRLTRYRYNNVPYDSNGHYYYIKEGDTIWNPGWMPTKTDLDSYECHHGMGYSTFKSSKNGHVKIDPDGFHIMKKSEYSGLFGDYSSYSEEYEELADAGAEPEEEESEDEE